MFNFLKPAPSKTLLPLEKTDLTYKVLRWQVFIGIFTGYAGYYLIRKNFSLAIPDLIAQGYSKTDLGIALSAISIAYGISKFVMGTISDRCNARVFLSLGLLLSGITMVFMGCSPWATSSISIMFILLFLNGWFQGMGWPPSARVMVHWFSQNERGTKMSIWNIAHNIGGGMVGPMATWAVLIFGTWQSKLYFHGLVAIGVAFLAYMLIRDTPASCGLPPIEEHRNDRSSRHSLTTTEVKLSTLEIFNTYILRNQLLWYIAIANIFIYLVRYGVLDWSPTYLKEVKGYSLSETGWAYFAYEYAGIPGTLLCGWISDKIFKGKRSPATFIYMLLVLIAVVVYWKNPPGHFWVDQIALIAIGFFIYGPVMLIGVFAIDLVPKNAAGTAAGFTGLFGYLGGSVFANMAMGVILEHWKWDGGFMVLVAACIASMILMIPAWQKENKPHLV